MESETWTSMVDSVIEFISASRATLQLLNDRLSDVEKRVQLEKRVREDDKIKQQFYKDCLRVKIDSEYTTKETSANILKERKPLKLSASTAMSNASTLFNRTSKPPFPKTKHTTGSQIAGYRSIHCGDSENIFSSSFATRTINTYNRSPSHTNSSNATVINPVESAPATKRNNISASSRGTELNLTERRSITKRNSISSTYGTEVNVLSHAATKSNILKDDLARKKRVSLSSTDSTECNLSESMAKAKRDRSRSRSRITSEKHMATQKGQLEKGLFAEGETTKLISKKLQTKEKSYSYIHRNKLTAKGDTKC